LYLFIFLEQGAGLSE